MTGPLIALALLVILGGSNYFTAQFVSVPHEAGFFERIPLLAVGALVIGAGLAFLLYRNRPNDVFDVAFLRRKFYFDELYDWLIARTQDALARIAAFFDRWIIDTAAVGGASGGTWGVGALLRFVQVGNLQAYAFFFGLGIVALIYFAVFY
jgi:NADH-quinone oxidoreductase subunit L